MGFNEQPLRDTPTEPTRENPHEKHPPWQPNYTITPATASGLMEIEAVRAVLAQVPLPVAVQAELRRRARVRSTHHFTWIEGNRLTLKEAQEVIDGRRTMFHGREQDVAEVRKHTGMRFCVWKSGRQRRRRLLKN